MAAQEKADVYLRKISNAKAALAAAEEKCKALAAKGLDVPAPGDCSAWKYCSPQAYFPPHIEAARARHEAKEAVAKEKEEKYKAAQAKIDEVKAKMKEDDGGVAVEDVKKAKASVKATKAMPAKKGLVIKKTTKAGAAAKAVKGGA